MGGGQQRIAMLRQRWKLRIMSSPYAIGGSEQRIEVLRQRRQLSTVRKRDAGYRVAVTISRPSGGGPSTNESGGNRKRSTSRSDGNRKRSANKSNRSRKLSTSELGDKRTSRTARQCAAKTPGIVHLRPTFDTLLFLDLAEGCYAHGISCCDARGEIG